MSNPTNQSIYQCLYFLALGVAIISLLPSPSSPLYGSTSSLRHLGWPTDPKTKPRISPPRKGPSQWRDPGVVGDHRRLCSRGDRLALGVDCLAQRREDSHLSRGRGSSGLVSRTICAAVENLPSGTNPSVWPRFGANKTSCKNVYLQGAVYVIRLLKKYLQVAHVCSGWGGMGLKILRLGGRAKFSTPHP
jgi:hypothetical protein